MITKVPVKHKCMQAAQALTSIFGEACTLGAFQMFRGHILQQKFKIIRYRYFCILFHKKVHFYTRTVNIWSFV